jgi:hypothetical protein
VGFARTYDAYSHSAVASTATSLEPQDMSLLQAPTSRDLAFATGVPHSRTSRWAVIAAAGLVVLASTAPFLSSLRGYFVGDVFGLVQLFSHQPTLHFLSLFTNPWTEDVYGYRADELRPIVAALYQADSLWGANNPVGYHVTTIAIHVLSTFLILVCGRIVCNLRLPAATFGAVLFAVLPVQAGAVAYIDGRVDSLPALFHLSTLLAFIMWRRTGAPTAYWLAMVLAFCALFTKQSAITLVATIVAYDTLVLRIRPFWRISWWGPYIPFVVLTAGFLVLRYVLFGNALREDQNSLLALATFGWIQAAHLNLLVFGPRHFSVVTQIVARFPVQSFLVTWAATLWLLSIIAVEAKRAWRGVSGGTRGLIVFFGPTRWLISVLPLVMTYVTARHVYLAAMGSALAAGLVLDLALARCRGGLRRALAAVAVIVVCAYVVLQQQEVSYWNEGAAISERVTRDFEHEVNQLPTGSLVVLDAPATGEQEGQNDGTPIPIWMWGLPYAVRPPFVALDLSQRVSVIGPLAINCCPPGKWFDDTSQVLGSWVARSDKSPVVVLRWDATTGTLVRVTEADAPQLRQDIESLAQSPTPREMQQRFAQLLNKLISPV